MDFEAKIEVPFEVPEEAGEFDLKVYVICDSYRGVDQEHVLKVKVSS